MIYIICLVLFNLPISNDPNIIFGGVIENIEYTPYHKQYFPTPNYFSDEWNYYYVGESYTVTLKSGPLIYKRTFTDRQNKWLSRRLLIGDRAKIVWFKEWPYIFVSPNTYRF